MTRNKPATELLERRHPNNYPHISLTPSSFGSWLPSINGVVPSRLSSLLSLVHGLHFSLNFGNIWSLYSTFYFVKHHLCSSRPNILFLTDLGFSSLLTESPSEFILSVSILIFSENVCCTYVRKEVVCFCVSNLEFSKFFTKWIWLSCQRD